MNRDRKNVLVLSACQMLFGTGRSLTIATAPLIAYGIAEYKGLATRPTSLVIVGTALSTIPASLLMRRVGRRIGFLVGSLIGAIGGTVSVVAIMGANFWLFALGALIYGSFAGFAQHYRFAAADEAAPEFKSTAISLVLAGGVVAGFAGPELAKAGKDLFTSAPFVGGYMFLIGTTVAGAFVLGLLNIPSLTEEQRRGPQRPIATIMAQPVFIAASLAAMTGQGVMNFMMTATPIAMVKLGHPFADTALVIQWHILGMYAPGFVTGALIRRFGEVRIILSGLGVQFICVAAALSGHGVFEFWLAMMLLGVGWNFAFTGATSLMTTAYTAAERAKTQGAMNFIIYGFVAIMSFSSGALVHYFGWMWVSLGTLPFLAIGVTSILWYAASQAKAVAKE